MKNTFIQDDSGDKKYFTIIPNYILNHSTLWDREVYIQMKRITGEDGTCWTSQKTLAKQCGVSINRLKKSIAYLVDHKWIQQIGKKTVMTKGGAQEVNEYKIADLWKMNVEYYEEKKGVSRDDTPISKGVSRTKPKGYHENIKGVSPDDDKEEPYNNIPIKQEAETSSAEIVTIIDLFEKLNPEYKSWYGNKTQRSAINSLIEKYGAEKVINMVTQLPNIVSKKFAPKITTPFELKRDLGKLLLFMKQNGHQQIRVAKL